MSISPPQMEIPRRGETPRDRYVATAFSFIFHGALLAFLIWVGIPEVSDLLEGELGGGGGGSGGDEISLISLAGPPEQVALEPVPVPPPPPDPEVVPDPTATPVPPPPTDTVKKPPAPAPVLGTPVQIGSSTGGNSDGSGAGSAGSGGGAGGGSGGGVGTGTGAGTGAGSGDGTGGGGTSPDGIIPPSPTALHLGPPAPNDLRGQTVIVLLTIDTSGKVTEARLERSTGNSKYDAALRKSSMGWRFKPARDRTGAPVKGTFPITYTI